MIPVVGVLDQKQAGIGGRTVPRVRSKDVRANATGLGTSLGLISKLRIGKFLYRSTIERAMVIQVRLWKLKLT